MAKRGSGGENTSERILEAALPLFAAHGFAGTSTRMVARAAGVNVATLAYYFDGKEGLYLTVLQRLHEDLAGFLPSKMPALGPELPRWLAEEAWAFCREHRQHIRLLLRHVLDQGLHEETVFEEFHTPLLDRVTRLLGVLRPEWTPTRMRLFTLSVMHMLVRLAIEDEDQLAVQLGGAEDVDAEVVGWLEELIRVQLGLGA